MLGGLFFRSHLLCRCGEKTDLTPLFLFSGCAVADNDKFCCGVVVAAVVMVAVAAVVVVVAPWRIMTSSAAVWL